MSLKPGDFYLGIVDFLGILVPGAALVFTQGYRILPALANPSSASEWVVFLSTAFIAGQLLLAVSEVLNGLAFPLVRVVCPQFYKDVRSLEAKASPLLRTETVADRGPTLFHAAVSYVRLESPEAAAEVDRHMADYKLLRSLILVLLFDCLASVLLGPQSHSRMVIDVAFAFLSFGAFARMHCWAHLLVFQYICLINAPGRHGGTKQ